MSEDYKVRFFGTDAGGERRIQVMSQVQRILKLREHHLLSLFEKPEGVDLYHTSDRSKAKLLVRKLVDAGARAELVDPREPARATPGDWELVDKTGSTNHVFHCRACNHSERLPLTEPLPAVCPECGVVATKFQEVARKKRERERIRQSIIDLEKAKVEKSEAASERAREAELRKQIEREVRRELGIATPTVRRIRGMAAASVVFALGVLGTMGFNVYRSSVDPMPQTVQNNAPRPTLGILEHEQTIAHANKLASTLTGVDWHQMGELSAGPTLPTVDREPWLNAPPTAAGDSSRPAGKSRQSKTVQGAPVGFDITADAMGRFVDAWYAEGIGDPLDMLRLKHLASDLLAVGRADEALQTATWVDQVDRRLALLQHITEHAAQSADEGLKKHLRDRLTAMTDGEGNASEQVPELLALENLLNHQAGGDVQPDTQARLLKLINGRQLVASDAVALHALVAVQRSGSSGPDAAERWFAEANRAFDRIEGPLDQLTALAVLARAYQAAGDQRTAERLVRRIRAGVDTLDEAAPNRLHVIDQLVESYIAIGHIDAALEMVENVAPTSLDADLQRARLAVELAAANRLTSARGVVAMITHPAARARALARLSAIAALQERFPAAQVLVDAAVVDIRLLAPAGQALLASELTPPLPDDIVRLRTAEADKRGSAHGANADRQWAIVAMNLAWNQSGTTARQLSTNIEDEILRRKTQQRIDELVTLFDSATTVPAG